MPECLFGDGPAVGRFFLNQGCVAYRDVQEQNLCMQHLINATPIDSMELVEDYTVEGLGSIG